MSSWHEEEEANMAASVQSVSSAGCKYWILPILMLFRGFYHKYRVNKIFFSHLYACIPATGLLFSTFPW